MISSDHKEPMDANATARVLGIRAASRYLSGQQQKRFSGYAGYVVLLTLLFIHSLTSLILYVASSDLHSHVLLVPFVSGYLLYLRRGRLLNAKASSIIGTVAVSGVGIATLIAGIEWRGSLSVNDELALLTLAYLSFLVAGGFLFLGSQWMRAALFPMAFLIFMVPLPDAAVTWLEGASASASAEVATLFFRGVGTPVVQSGTLLELPGIALRVADECSGIHSSWVLFITSLIASNLFLKTSWRRTALIAFIIPLGILRNGFRILVIGLLCVNFGPQMIDSPIHRRGGPVFFALSLIPLFMLLWWLRRQEFRSSSSETL